MLTSYYRKRLAVVGAGAGDYIREWLEYMIKRADAGDEDSERQLKLFLKYRRKTDRSSVAYAMLMDNEAQDQIRLDE